MLQWSHESGYVGFRAAWDSAYCHGHDEKIGAGVQTITDGSPDEKVYERATNCTWLLRPKYGGPIHLEFERLQVGEHNCTYIGHPPNI